MLGLCDTGGIGDAVLKVRFVTALGSLLTTQRHSNEAKIRACLVYMY